MNGFPSVNRRDRDQSCKQKIPTVTETYFQICINRIQICDKVQFRQGAFSSHQAKRRHFQCVRMWSFILALTWTAVIASPYFVKATPGYVLQKITPGLEGRDDLNVDVSMLFFKSINTYLLVWNAWHMARTIDIITQNIVSLVEQTFLRSSLSRVNRNTLNI